MKGPIWVRKLAELDKIVDYLSSYASALTYDEFPAEVVAKAKDLIVDTIGCALGAYGSEPARIARELAGTVSSTQPATILVGGQLTTPDLAAFANGTMIRYLDFNDGYTSVDSGHPSDTIAAVLSPAEVARADGKAFITATVLAYEAFCRLCDAVGVRNRGYDHVTLGVIASGLGAAKAMGLSKEQTAQILNLCVAADISLHQTRIGDLSMWNGCAFANASRNAVFAAQLAQRGLTGPDYIFEGRQGFFPVIAGGPFTLERFGGNGRPFKIMQCTIKRFPLGLYSQTVAEAALEVRDKIGSVEDIAEVNVSTLETAVRIMAGDEEKWRPTTRETADHSMPYTVAVALMHGTVEARHFRRGVPSGPCATGADPEGEGLGVGGGQPAGPRGHAQHSRGCYQIGGAHPLAAGPLPPGPLEEPDGPGRDRGQVPLPGQGSAEPSGDRRLAGGSVEPGAGRGYRGGYRRSTSLVSAGGCNLRRPIQVLVYLAKASGSDWEYLLSSTACPENRWFLAGG